MSKKTENDMITKVIIENFPSRTELYGLLDKFLEINNYTKDYVSDNKDLIIVFSFKNPVYNLLSRMLHLRLLNT